ncbi:SH3 domain-containing protein [Pontibacillus yanchengensis]|uniref:SH3 domain-containing protein n=1 Tax=Pontibacillus yanchengensis TaxID=462910 RepID=A0ACC7VH24_9BACI|nr:N-acetylmuramoyl-L-alanine amidase [Pontibacillus yanchengensis]MYL53990.1 SH3 domain-containing protein [Pontibacillus yanchengensis]
MTARMIVGTLLSFVMLLFVPVVAHAAEDWVELQDEKADVETDKEWTIKFNTSIDSDSVNNENIYIHSLDGEQLSPSLSLSEDGKTITVEAPKDGYEPEQTYMLFVSDAITSQAGSMQMEKGYKQAFTITKDASAEAPEEPVEDPTPQPEPEPEPKEVVSTGTVTADVLNIRSKPSADGEKLGQLSYGDKVEIYSFTDFWAEIEYNGETAYVHKTYMKLRVKGGTAVEGQRIVVDAGHGDHDPGAQSGGAKEKEINLDVAQRVAENLKELGATPILVRDNDRFVTLKGRVEYAKEVKGDLFVSVHTNAASPAAKGAETFYSENKYSNVREGRLLATTIQNQLVDTVGMADRGVKASDFYVIRHNTLPSVLVELGFVTNNDDFKKLTSDYYRNLYAQAITNGIVNYYEEDVD